MLDGFKSLLPAIGIVIAAFIFKVCDQVLLPHSICAADAACHGIPGHGRAGLCHGFVLGDLPHPHPLGLGAAGRYSLDHRCPAVGFGLRQSSLFLQRFQRIGRAGIGLQPDQPCLDSVAQYPNCRGSGLRRFCARRLSRASGKITGSGGPFTVRMMKENNYQVVTLHKLVPQSKRV